MHVLNILLGFAYGLLQFTSIETACGLCSPDSYTACVSETTFRFCANGDDPVGEVINCSDGTVCTNALEICQPKSLTVALGCKPIKCGECGGKFACISKTQFAYCGSDGIITQIHGTCPQGQFCDINNFAATQNVCSPSSCVAAQPTCDNTEVTLPTGDYKDSCRDVQAPGYYVNIYDTSCKTYVYCERLDGIMYSALFNCTAGFFNGNKAKCEPTKLAGCK